MSHDTEEVDDQLYKDTLIDVFGEENVWTTQELTQQFDVESFLAPYCFATRKSDGVKGMFEFNHSPRFYFNFKPNSIEYRNQ